MNRYSLWQYLLIGAALLVGLVYTLPNFYGAHGHDSELESMSATLLAAGPKIRENKSVPRVRNIDVAPTIMHILGVKPGSAVDGRVLEEILR